MVRCKTLHTFSDFDLRYPFLFALDQTSRWSFTYLRPSAAPAWAEVSQSQTTTLRVTYRYTYPGILSFGQATLPLTDNVAVTFLSRAGEGRENDQSASRRLIVVVPSISVGSIGTVRTSRTGGRVGAEDRVSIVPATALTGGITAGRS